MRKLLLIVITMSVLPLLSEQAWSADPTVVACAQCRDVYEHPGDYGNHAYNQVFGRNPTLSFVQGDLMRIVAPSGQWAVVDLNFIFQATGLSLNLAIVSYAYSIPTGKVQMVVQDPRGGISEFQAFAASPDLLVGDGAYSPPAPDPEPEPEPEPATNQAVPYGGATEIICCQSGTFYWYYSQPAFSGTLQHYND